MDNSSKTLLKKLIGGAEGADFTRIENDPSAICAKMSNKILALKIDLKCNVN